MGREFMAGTQHSGVTGGIVRAKLWQCGQTPDIRRIGCELGELAAYPQIGSNDPRHTRCRAAPRWIMTGADEKVAGRPSRSSATPLPRRSWKAISRPKLCFTQRRSSKNPTLGETYSKNLKWLSTVLYARRNFITVSHGSREGIPPVEATARRAMELLEREDTMIAA